MRIEGIDSTPINKSENNTYIKASEATGDFLIQDIFEESDGNNFFATEETDKSGEVFEQIKDKASMLKDNIEVICDKMETGAVVEMDEEGVDINNTEVEELRTVVEQIQMKLAMYCDDFVPTVDIDAGETGISPEEVQIRSAANTAQNIGEITDEAKAYILKNNLEPTIKNLYIANHSGMKPVQNTLSEADWQQMRPQVEEIAKKSGAEDSEKAVAQGKWLIENGISVTVDNFDKLNELNNITGEIDSSFVMERIQSTVMEGYVPENTVLTGKKLPWENTLQAMDTLNNMTDGDIAALVDSEKVITIENLAAVSQTNTDKDELAEQIKENSKYAKVVRQMQEARLIMTLEAGRFLEKNGISVNTEEITKLIDELRRYEMDAVNQTLPEGNEKVTYDEIVKTNDVLLAVDGLKSAPSAVIGSVDEGAVVSVERLTANVGSVTAKIRAAGEAYEALSTEIRSDLGDSVSKAVKASTGDILAELEYEDNDANRRAVRIIAYNNLDMTTDNIDRIKNLDMTVNKLFENMTPEGTLHLIREDINPLEMSVEELNDYFVANQSQSKAPEEKFSEFLYRIEKGGEITPQEREKYIGIYSLVNTFENDGMNALGSLLNQGLELNMGNLLSAYMTSKDKGMELVAGDGEQVIKVNDRLNYYKKLFGDVANKLTPEKLATLGDETDNMSLEEFANEIDEMETPAEDEVYKRYMDTIKDAANLEESIFKMVTTYEIPTTFNNLFAAQTVIQKPADIFSKYQENTDDEDYENELFEALDNKEELKKEYDSLVESARAIINSAVYQENSFVNMEELRLLGNNMSVINSLAQQNNFYIPYETETGKAVINLKVVEDGENRGRFNIKLTDANAGRVTIDGKINENSVTALVMCEYREGVADFSQKAATITEIFEQQGYEKVSIMTNQVSEQPDLTAKENAEISVNQLFKAAKVFITELTK